ncbi:MAG: phospholipase D-like domain-containing protein [Planctomycetota bacterium]|jgi:phosphatidylserine/phosphatidylglycerophosphate/cardiolipin synthase-like enzyme
MALQYLEHDELYRDALLRALSGARRSLWLATANVKQTLVEDGPRKRFTPVAKVLGGLASRGIEVRLLHSGKPSGPFMQSLRESRAPESRAFGMRRCPRVHFKAIIVDGAEAYLGSANLTGAGLGAKAAERRNFEVGVWTDDQGIVERLKDLFMALWGGAFCDECGQRDNCASPLAGPEV